MKASINQSRQQMLVLVVGATGSVGRLVVARALQQELSVRALVRTATKASQLPRNAEIVVGDVTDAESLKKAVDGVDGIIITLGSDGSGRTGARNVDYGGVKNILQAIGPRKVRIALMTSIGVTNRDSAYNRSTEAHDWKRRSERLVRASSHPYTIVRPGWFDYNGDDEHQLVFLQGDRRHAGNSSDGAIAREQIAQVLVTSILSDHALRKTFELVAVQGPAQSDLDSLFASVDADAEGELDAIKDLDNMPIEGEPPDVKADLNEVVASQTK